MAVDRVLIIDDNADFRVQLRRILEAEGCQVEETSLGQAGIAAAAADPPDVILLDHRIPDMEGLDVLAELRRANITTPVVAVTGWGDEAVATRYLSEGAVEYLSKDHITPLRLVQTVRSAYWVTRGSDPSDPGVEPARAVESVMVVTPRGLGSLHLSGLESDDARPVEIVRAPSIDAAVELLERSRPACVLLEILPGADVADAVGRLLEAAPGLPVVVMVDSDGEAAQAIDAGATDYINRGRATDLRVRHTLHMACDRSRRPGTSVSH